ncbi:MAG: OmpH family outer membrane protein [bacterium]
MTPRTATPRTWGAGLIHLGWACTLILAILLIASPRPNAAGFAVGFVDTKTLLESHPRFKAAEQTVATYRTSRQKELDGFRNRVLTDDEKKTLMLKNESIIHDIALKEQEVLDPLAGDVQKAISTVGQAGGYEVVMEKAAVLFGGIDLTPLVKVELQKY